MEKSRDNSYFDRRKLYFSKNYTIFKCLIGIFHFWHSEFKQVSQGKPKQNFHIYTWKK